MYRMHVILKLHNYRHAVGRAKQDARAEEKYFRDVQDVLVQEQSCTSSSPTHNLKQTITQRVVQHARHHARAAQ